jgi:hypothetical protein
LKTYTSSFDVRKEREREREKSTTLEIFRRKGKCQAVLSSSNRRPVGIRENGVETNEGDLQFQRLGRRQKKVSSRPVFGGKIAAFFSHAIYARLG